VLLSDIGWSAKQVGNDMTTFKNQMEREQSHHQWDATRRARSLVKSLEDDILSRDPRLIARLIEEIAHHCKLAKLV
jgi:hypothetical protein